MSMNEMMRDSANQKRERERQERTAAEKIEALKSQASETNRKLEEIADGLRGLDEQIQNQKSDGLSTAEAETVHQLAKIAKQKQQKTAEQLNAIDQLTGQMQRATRQIDDRAQVLEETAEAVEQAPEPIARSAEKARREVERAISWLGLKAAGIGVLIAVMTMTATAGAGWWYLSSQGLTVETMNEEERTALSLGKATRRASGNWTDEEMKTWEELIGRTSSKTD